MDSSFVVITKNTIISVPEHKSTAVEHVIKMVKRDHYKVFGVFPDIRTFVAKEAQIVIKYAEKEEECSLKPEAYSFRFVKNDDKYALHIIGYDDLGIIYGLLHYSHHYLEVDPFWLWADIPIKQKDSIQIPIKDFDSPIKKVKYRGWFVNDEVCLIGWKDAYPPTKDVWYPVFEALLRCGGNMVIPGTDLPKDGIHLKLASEMGLWVTHHHAEPLGAEMFLRAFPGKRPSYKEHPLLFESLWKQAIEEQKDQKVIWVLSFRGQGDAPFWQYDPEFDTPQKRGEMITKVVRRQYELVCESVENQVCSIALYGEIAELYKAGFIDIPDGIIKIWADNGYGKMVSRRQGNENLRISSMPSSNSSSEQGVYYHITFHDLQASNHLTMFPSPPELIKDQLEKVVNNGAVSYLLLNSGNIRPHLYPLDLVKEIWSNGYVNIQEHFLDFVNRLYSTNTKEIAQAYEQYFHCTIPYGSHKDDKAGEEFYHHPARRILSHWLQGKGEEPEPKLFWATEHNRFTEQVGWFKTTCEKAVVDWEKLLGECKDIVKKLPEHDAKIFYDQFVLHVELHVSGCKGFIALCEAYFCYQNGDNPLSFVWLYKSIQFYQTGKQALKTAEHGKWENFYRGDWLTNIDSTIYSLDATRKFIRMNGDSPDFFLWNKEFLMPETEKHIYLENTHRNPLSDDELAIKLANKFWGESK
ncbi:MAG TPA: glycosyl hydrolase 115 family protein [Niallia sp.]|nr:glycosyl hydrolase 115 family protein [Niallia sp.]